MLNGKPLNDFTDHNGDGLVDDLDIYEDLNGDGIINEDDLAIVGTAIPDWILGLTANVRWRKFDFSGTLRANLGNSVYNNVASSLGYYQGLTESNVTNNIHESAFINDFNERQLKSDVYIEDASFLRLDNISVGYNFDFSRIIQSLRIYATAQNLLTITQYSGIDPELPQFATGPFDGPGIDNNVYPISRRFILGINANF
jgi:iron complex outermembrane receptor protein